TGKQQGLASPARGLPDRAGPQERLPPRRRIGGQREPEGPRGRQRASPAARSRRPGQRTRGDAGDRRVGPHDAALREAMKRIAPTVVVYLLLGLGMSTAAVAQSLPAQD